MIVINQINLIGRFVNNPTKRDKSYSFIFVVSDYNMKPVYFHCYAVKRLENIMSHLKKGDMCRLSGSLVAVKRIGKYHSYSVFVNEVELFPKGLSSDELVSEVETFEEDLELSEL